MVSKSKPAFATWICPALLMVKKPSPLSSIIAKVVASVASRIAPTLVFMAEPSAILRDWLAIAMVCSMILSTVMIIVLLLVEIPSQKRQSKIHKIY